MNSIKKCLQLHFMCFAILSIPISLIGVNEDNAKKEELGCWVEFTEVPEDISIECWEEVPDPLVLIAIDCENEEYIVEPEVFIAESCNGTGLVTYFYSLSPWGEEVTAEYTIFIINSSPLLIECPSDAVVSDLSNADPSITGVAVGEQECGGPFVDYMDEFLSNPPRILRTWTATNSCLEEASCEQVIWQNTGDECFSIEAVIDAPSSQVQGLAFDGSDLWSAEHTGISQVDLIHRISTTDGTILQTIPTATSTYVGGLAFIGEDLWMTDRNNLQLLSLSTTTGAAVNSIQLDPDRFFDLNETVILGLAAQEGDLWFSARFDDGDVDSTYRITTSGNILEAFPAAGNVPSGLAYDNQSIWFGNNGGNSSIDRIDPNTFEVLESYSVPGGNFPNGLAYDGEFLWIAENGSDAIFKMGICPLTFPPVYDVLEDEYLQECTGDGPDPSILGINAVDPDGTAVAYEFAQDDFIAVSCGSGLGVYFYTVIATDEQNEMTSAQFAINYFDTTPPSISVGADVTIECGDDLPDPSASVSDSCGSASWTVSESVVSFCGDAEQLTRTYTAFDDCGNISMDTQVITIVDTTAPSISAASNVTIECGNSIPTPSADVSDACSDVTWTVSETTESFCGETEQIFRTYTATDECGNSATDTQIITIVDTTAPSINASSNMMIECGNAIPVPDATVSDTCGDVTWSVSESSESLCGDTEQISRTYTATDECGNTATDTQVITIVDTTAPSITASSNMTIECGNTIPVPDATVSDTCGDVTWTVSESLESLCGGTEQIIRTYTAVDACSNSATDTQVITTEDNTPPVLSCPPNVNVEDIENPIETGTATATDLCGVAAIDFSDGPITGVPGSFIRTWIAIDDCGNSSSCDQLISEEEVLGCTDPAACNFDPSATSDDGSCIIPSGCDECIDGALVDNPEIGDACDDGDPDTQDDVYVDCGDCMGVLVGCTDITACNYNPDAEIDNGTCYTIGDECDDDNPDTSGDVWVTCEECSGSIVGLLEFNYTSEFNVVPNPSNGLLSIYLNEELTEEFNWTCFDLLGKSIRSGQSKVNNGRTEIDLRGIASGGYFLRIEFKDGNGIQRIQIQQ